MMMMMILIMIITLLLAVIKTMPIGMKATAKQNSTGSIVDAVTSNLEADIFCCINGETERE